MCILNCVMYFMHINVSDQLVFLFNKLIMLHTDAVESDIDRVEFFRLNLKFFNEFRRHHDLFFQFQYHIFRRRVVISSHFSTCCFQFSSEFMLIFFQSVSLFPERRAIGSSYSVRDTAYVTITNNKSYGGVSIATKSRWPWMTLNVNSLLCRQCYAYSEETADARIARFSL